MKNTNKDVINVPLLV